MKVVPLFRHVPSQDFQEWYAAYPRKCAKADAEKAYLQQIRMGISHDLLLRGAILFAEMHKRLGTERQFICHPATFLRGQRFLDEELSEYAPPTEEELARAAASKDRADRYFKRGIYAEKRE